MSSPGDPPIIVQGGGQSITISFDGQEFPKDAAGTFASTSYNITHIEVVANGGGDTYTVDVKGGDATVKIVYE